MTTLRSEARSTKVAGLTKAAVSVAGDEVRGWRNFARWVIVRAPERGTRHGDGDQTQGVQRGGGKEGDAARPPRVGPRRPLLGDRRPDRRVGSQPPHAAGGDRPEGEL